MIKMSCFAILAAVAVLLVYVSTQSFFLAAGSDSTVSILSLPIGIKIAALAAWIISLYWACFGSGPMRSRIGLSILSALVLGLATHAVIVNFKRAVIQEHWFFAVWDRAPIDVADGLLEGWTVHRASLGVHMQDRVTGKSVFLLTAGLKLPPFLDPSPSP